MKRLKVHTASVKALVKSNEYIFSCSLDQQIIVSNYQVCFIFSIFRLILRILLIFN